MHSAGHAHSLLSTKETQGIQQAARRHLQIELAQRSLHRATWSERLAQSNLRKATRAEQLAQNNLFWAAGKEQLALSNLRRTTCAERRAQSSFRGAPCAQSDLHRASCTAERNLRREPSAENLRGKLCRQLGCGLCVSCARVQLPGAAVLNDPTLCNFLRASCSAQVALLQMIVQVCQFLCTSCSVQALQAALKLELLCKLLCASCSEQVAVRKLLYARWPKGSTRKSPSQRFRECWLINHPSQLVRSGRCPSRGSRNHQPPNRQRLALREPPRLGSVTWKK